jgi:putative transposase
MGIYSHLEIIMSATHHGLLVHIVFSTKLRYPLLADDWRDELFAYIGGTVRDHKATILQSGGIEDHIHLLAKIHPSFAISDTVKLLKANSSRWINEQRKLNAKFQWQRGYGVFSVSQSMADTLKLYIANQQAHHRNQSFCDEYLDLLRCHKIEFDERYVFDKEIIA